MRRPSARFAQASVLALSIFLSQAAAQTPPVPLPSDIRVVLASAAEAGDKALVDAVIRAIKANPALADQIVQEGFMQALENQIRLNPQYTTQILDAARGTGIPMDPARVQALARTGGVSFGGPGPLAVAGLSPAVAGGLAVAAAGGIAMAAGGGGGNDDGGGGDPDPGVFETAEYSAQYGLGLLNASSAYARGATGSGITVGVIDTGLDITHPEFAGRIVSPQNFAGDRLADDVTDDDDHGTHVAGIIAAAKNDLLMHGVAYDANIMPLRVFEADGSSTNQGFIDAYDYAVANGADVLNGSYGQGLIFGFPLLDNTDQGQYEAMKRATDAGIILVFATGNDGDDNPSVPALYPYVTPAHAGEGVYLELEDTHDFSALQGMLLAVTSVDANGDIAYYANQCGVAQDWCLAAPGGGGYDGFGAPVDPIISTVPGGGTDGMSGTSMAAPHVAGAVAVLLDMFPELTPAEIVQLILDTADSSFVGYDAAIYGQGRLDLNTATQPLGLTSIPLGPTVSGRQESLAGSQLVAGGALGNALGKALSGQKLVFLDSLKRAYVVDLASLAKAAGGAPLGDRIASFMARSGKMSMGAGNALAFTRNGTADDSGIEGISSVSFTHSLGKGETMTATIGSSPALMFGAAGQEWVDAQTASATGMFASPFLALDEGMGLSFASASGWTFGSFAGERDDLARSGAVAEYRTGSDDGALAARFGFTSEKGGFLGNSGSGAFAFGDVTPTVFGGLSASLPAAAGWRMLADADLGMSFARGAEGSLIDSVSPVETMSWSLGASRSGIINEGDRLMVSVGQPLHAMSGTAHFRLPTDRGPDGSIGYTSLAASLVPVAPEVKFAASYEHGGFGGLLSFSRNPGGVGDAADEAAVLLRYHVAW